MSRIRIAPPDNVTAGEWFYLKHRYPTGDEAAERRDRIVTALKRLVRKGRKAEQVHAALLRGIDLWEAHQVQQMSRKQMRQRSAAVSRAQRDVERAIASLRRLMPPDLRLTDDEVFEVRDQLLATAEVPPPVRPRGGRPWEWKQEAEEALRRAGVVASDRRELVAALGFADDQ